MNQPLAESAATLKTVREYFGMNAAEFRTEWSTGKPGEAKLTEDDKIQIRNGIGDGTLTY